MKLCASSMTSCARRHTNPRTVATITRLPQTTLQLGEARRRKAKLDRRTIFMATSKAEMTFTNTTPASIPRGAPNKKTNREVRSKTVTFIGLQASPGSLGKRPTRERIRLTTLARVETLLAQHPRVRTGGRIENLTTGKSGARETGRVQPMLKETSQAQHTINGPGSRRSTGKTTSLTSTRSSRDGRKSRLTPREEPSARRNSASTSQDKTRHSTRRTGRIAKCR